MECEEEKVQSMDLTTTYLGLKLEPRSFHQPAARSLAALTRSKHSRMPGASAIVMYSLFEEEILHESQQLDHYLTYGSDRSPELLSRAESLRDGS